MPWYTSWLPGLPSINFAIPTSIQGRFISFVLKKSLGHFLKPGQLDYHQIDSQIGSGYVQVNSLEINPEAINAHLDGLPISLQDGSISSVIARIPWPNPLASTLGFSIKSLHLRFQVLSSVAHSHLYMPEVDLADSVASVAESFIHEELDPREETNLRQSFYQEVADNYNAIPGALGDSNVADDGPPRFDKDPAGVSVFASLIESLLSRFEFDAQDIKITLVHPNNMEMTLSLQEIRYHTEAKLVASLDNPHGVNEGESRILTFHGLELAISNLFHSAPGSSLPTPTDSPLHRPKSAATSRPVSPTSSNSSLDEESQLEMSQSLVSLPPRQPSPTSSVSSSMYQSALSISSSPQPGGEVSDGTASAPSLRLAKSLATKSYYQQETLLSFGPQSVTIKLTTPPPVNKGEEGSPFLPGERDKPAEDELRVTVSMNVLACSILPWQIGAFLRLSQAIAPSDPRSHAPQRRPSSKSFFPPLTVQTHMRGCVILLNPTSPPKGRDESYPVMAEFFQQPLVPPRSEEGYTRIHLDTLYVSITIPSGNVIDEALKSAISFEARISDLSAFCFNKRPEDGETSPELGAFPLLITDPHLSTQYSAPHLHPESDATYPVLPSFEIIDWTCKSFGPKLSLWRCRLPKSESNQPALEVPVASIPALQLFGHQTITKSKRKPFKYRIVSDLEMKVAPIHIRIDLYNMFQPGSLISFYNELLLLEAEFNEESSILSQATVDDYFSGTGRTDIHEELETPFGDPVRPVDSSSIPASPAQQSGGSEEDVTLQTRLVINLPFARCSLRCPSPQCGNRSGIIVVDLREIGISTGPELRRLSARFSRQDQSPTRRPDISDESVSLTAQFRRAVIGCSMVGSSSATSFLSIGGLKDEMDFGRNQDELSYSSEDETAPLQPCIRVFRPNLASSMTTPILALSIDIPSIHADISKIQLDALQYFADDITQFLEHVSSKSSVNLELELDSRDTSLIGSRFFAKSRSGSGLSKSVNESAESVMKLTITETFVRIAVPRSDDDLKLRPFDLKASDLDILLEQNPDGKQQTVLTLGVVDMAIHNIANDGAAQTFLKLTSPYSLADSTKSIIKFRFSTSTVPETNTKETRIKLTMCGFTYTFFPDLHWISDLALFAKNPPGTFESVIPSDRTRIFVKMLDGSIRIFVPNSLGGIVLHLQELGFSTDVVGDSRDSSFHINALALSLLALDNGARQEYPTDSSRGLRGVAAWMASGYALISEVEDLDMFVVNHLNGSPVWKADIHQIVLRLHLCADTLAAITTLTSDLGTLGRKADNFPEPVSKGPATVNPPRLDGSSIMSSVEDMTFKRVPEIGPAPDMIYDDLPTNLDYLDDSFGAAAGLREIRDEDLDEFDNEEISDQGLDSDPSIVSRVGGETIKLFNPEALEAVEDYYLTLPPDASHHRSDLGEAKFSVRVLDGTFNLFLYDGYDWAKTRKTIEEEVKEMRKRLAKIRQLVANGHMQDPILEDTSALLYNSVHIGLDDDEDALGEPAALIAAIDRELKDDTETTSWQSLPTFNPGKLRVPPVRVHGKRLTRSRSPSMEFCLKGLHAEFDQFRQDEPLVSRTFITVRNLEILDHIKTSTWKKFLTELRSDSRGNVRVTDSDMVRIELLSVRPVPGDSSEEARLKAKILPLRLYVDQDAVDFLKKFFSFKDPHVLTTETSETPDAYIQLAEIFPIDLKLDYKPRRVDYRALKEGKTIELMNFFHFDGAEMTLRHITLAGVTGWPRLFEMLNDLWTPDVKATQLMEVISGVAPIRSMVNVGSGVADLILLPIAQYKKDGRIVRGVQKGATAFVKSTAIEAIRMGAKLATGTQVILEQAEGILGGQFEVPLTAEPLQMTPGEDYPLESEENEDESADLVSKYSQQPVDLKEGVQFAYKSLQRNLSSAAQTILAVPMEVYERSGNEGPVRSVIRAVPIAVLKPMIGASEAVSKTLLGLHNTLDPNVRHENEAKYK